MLLQESKKGGRERNTLCSGTLVGLRIRWRNGCIQQLDRQNVFFRAVYRCRYINDILRFIVYREITFICIYIYISTVKTIHGCFSLDDMVIIQLIYTRCDHRPKPVY